MIEWWKALCKESQKSPKRLRAKWLFEFCTDCGNVKVLGSFFFFKEKVGTEQHIHSCGMLPHCYCFSFPGKKCKLLYLETILVVAQLLLFESWLFVPWKKFLFCEQIALIKPWAWQIRKMGILSLCKRSFSFPRKCLTNGRCSFAFQSCYRVVLVSYWNRGCVHWEKNTEKFSLLGVLFFSVISFCEETRGRKRNSFVCWCKERKSLFDKKSRLVKNTGLIYFWSFQVCALSHVVRISKPYAKSIFVLLSLEEKKLNSIPFVDG